MAEPQVAVTAIRDSAAEGQPVIAGLDGKPPRSGAHHRTARQAARLHVAHSARHLPHLHEAAGAAREDRGRPDLRRGHA